MSERNPRTDQEAPRTDNRLAFTNRESVENKTLVAFQADREGALAEQFIRRSPSGEMLKFVRQLLQS